MRLLYHSIIAFCLLLFLGLQSFEAAHAATHMDEPHEHECVVCEGITASDEQVARLPPPAPKSAHYIYMPAHYSAPALKEIAKQTPTCIPPPRAPPA